MSPFGASLDLVCWGQSHLRWSSESQIKHFWGPSVWPQLPRLLRSPHPRLHPSQFPCKPDAGPLESALVVTVDTATPAAIATTGQVPPGFCGKLTCSVDSRWTSL